MNIQRATPINEFLAKVVFLLLPAAVVSYYLLLQINIRYSILQNQAAFQSLFFAAGMGMSALLYSFRVRFWPTFAALIFLFFSLYKGIENYTTGEMDVFFLTVRFLVFSMLFGAGWFVGWGFIRLRYFALVLSLLLLTGCIALIASSKPESAELLIANFAPAILYVIYNIFTAEQIYNYKDKSKVFWWYLVRRLLLFVLLCGVILGAVIALLFTDIKETVANYGGGKSGNQNSMLKKNEDGTFDINQYSRLRSHLDRDKQLLFCAHINNFFEGTDIPNPLYLTAFYFTKFDTATETFEREENLPYNDLFKPDPSKVPLFSTRIDSNVIKNSLGDIGRKVIDVEIYNCILSSSTYLAPNVGFFVQPITVEKDFRDKFTSAYRVKSYISELNSAYFVYNVDTPQIRKFQEMRFKELRTVTNYKGVDSTFMAYYTRMPAGKKFSVISEMAHQIMDTAKLPVDKVLAIRNYFLSKNESEEPLYKYTDNPGEPDIPSASRLIDFLTVKHKGYCAYYAGATLFMLRAAGIPSRIVVGFLTQDRSDKNAGWYYYYANQAHAWVQVYFPGYGWLDFDFTVGNSDENRPTPQPDGTPPMQPPKAWLALEGTVESTDTTQKLMKLKVKNYVFHDVQYTLEKPVVLSVDMKAAEIHKDSLLLKLAQVAVGEQGTLVSYAEVFKNMQVARTEQPIVITNKWPVPLPADELYLKVKPKDKKEEKPKPNTTAKVDDPLRPFWIAGGLLLFSLLLLLLLPQLLLQYYLLRYRNAKNDAGKAYWGYRATMYYLHMVGMPRGTKTPMQYALQTVDGVLGMRYSSFMSVYLKQKYGSGSLNSSEQTTVRQVVVVFLQTARKKFSFGERVSGFLNPVRMAAFFTMPEDDEKEM
jgi:protein-glutamine gamma-glutamyltransferase